MSVSGTIVACVAIVTWGVVRLKNGPSMGRRHLMARDLMERGQIEQPLISQRETEMAAELERMRERIKVLERITVDERQSRSVAAEIEALRDK